MRIPGSVHDVSRATASVLLLVAVGMAQSGATWHPVGVAENDVNALHGHTSAGGETALYVAGDFGSIDGVAGTNGLARWDGSAWTSVGGGLPLSGNDDIRALATYQGDLYAGGQFQTIGGVALAANNVAVWNGTAWGAVGVGPGGVTGSGSGTAVRTMKVFQGDLIVAGAFQAAAGGVAVDDIARWNASTAWNPVGSMWPGPFTVFALEVYDAGNGPELYAGGAGLLRLENGITNSTAPDTWNAMSNVTAAWSLAVHDPGTGPRLYAAGHFATCTDPIPCVGAWDGTSWTLISSPVGGNGIESLVVYDDNTGPALHGHDRDATNQGRVWRLVGTNWVQVGSTFNKNLDALGTFAGGLYAAGEDLALISELVTCPATTTPGGTTTLAGSCGDLILTAGVDGPGGFFPLVRSASPGSIVSLALESPGGSLETANPVLVGQVFANNGSMLTLPTTPGFPCLHVDATPFAPTQLIVLADGTAVPFPFGPLALGSSGLHVSVAVPAGLGGLGAVFQGAVLGAGVSSPCTPTPSVPFVASNAQIILF